MRASIIGMYAKQERSARVCSLGRETGFAGEMAARRIVRSIGHETRRHSKTRRFGARCAIL